MVQALPGISEERSGKQSKVSNHSSSAGTAQMPWGAIGTDKKPKEKPFHRSPTGTKDDMARCTLEVQMIDSEPKTEFAAKNGRCIIESSKGTSREQQPPFHAKIDISEALKN